MPKFQVCVAKQLELRGYVTVEAENEEQAWRCLDWLGTNEIDWNNKETLLETEVLWVDKENDEVE